MALSKEIYSAFENVVGTEYISNDPAMMPAYHQIQFAAIIIGMNLPEALPDSVAFAVIFPLAIISEEIAKSSSVAVLLQNRDIGSWRSVVKYSFFAAFGFFIGEKLLLYLTLSVVSETMFVEAALESGWLLLPLAMHFVSTTVVGLFAARLGVRLYPLALAAGAIIHGAYNLIVMRGAIF